MSDPGEPIPRILIVTGIMAAGKSTIALGPSNFVELFEFFNDTKNDLAAAEASVGKVTPQGPTETINLYERRMRTREENLIKAKGPIEGRIDHTTFTVDLPAVVTERDGCSRSVATADMSELPFDLFRGAMGTVAAAAKLSMSGSTNIETAQFTIEGARRFEAIGRCGTTGTKLKLTMSRSWDGKWTGAGGF